MELGFKRVIHHGYIAVDFPSLMVFGISDQTTVCGSVRVVSHGILKVSFGKMFSSCEDTSNVESCNLFHCEKAFACSNRLAHFMYVNFAGELGVTAA